jgi:drug/metabolite transporter (DMT)-like permease
MLLGNVLLSFGPWFVRLTEVGPVAAAFWRLALAAPLLLLLARRFDGPWPKLPRGLWLLLALGGVMFAADLGSWHLGILRTRLANAALFGNMAAFFFPIYGFLMARALPGRVQTGAFLLAAAGTVMLLGRSYEVSPDTLVGDLLCLLAGVLYTGYFIVMERARLLLRSWQALGTATLGGILPLLLFATLMGERIVPHDWTPLILLALCSQVIGQGLLVWSIAHLSPLVIGLGLLLQPVTAAAVGWLAYGERLGPWDMAGATMIAVALVLVRLKR